jgi:ElaB/YqjD/DUF883 family membrane-anchored ribosome-binding protein
MSEIDATYSAAAAQGDKEALKNKAVAAKDAVADLAGEAKHYAAHRVSDAKDAAAGWVETGKEKVADMSECAVDYVQRNPYTALAIAAGIGFVAGLILKRR